MTAIRFAPAAAAGLVLAAGVASQAGAQSRCGASYEVQAGDTLYGISQSCRVTLARIMDLNPALGDPRDIAVGTELRLETEAGGGAGVGGQAPAEGYRVEPGDTLFSVAAGLGVSVIELINENPEVDPLALAVGEVLDVPGDEPGAAISIAPQSGPPGSAVTVEARNLRPNDWVTIGVGPKASEWSSLREVETGPDGALAAEVAVPDWTDPRQRLIFVVDTDRGITLKSDVFDVTAREAGDGDEGDDRLALEGRVHRGAECYTLTTPDGDTWSMVSDSIPFTVGEYVEVTGRQADMSFCMAGTGTIEVGSIEEVDPPSERN